MSTLAEHAQQLRELRARGEDWKANLKLLAYTTFEAHAEEILELFSGTSSAALSAPEQAPVASTVEEKLTAAGFFGGQNGLRGLVNADEFWDRQMYGTRLYYGDGTFDYLHRSVLQTVVKLLDGPVLAPPATQVGELLRELDKAARHFYAMVEGESPSLLEGDTNAERLRNALEAARQYVASVPSGFAAGFEQAREAAKAACEGITKYTQHQSKESYRTAAACAEAVRALQPGEADHG